MGQQSINQTAKVAVMCVKCKQYVPSLYIECDMITIKCECGCVTTISIEDYLIHYEKNKAYKVTIKPLNLRFAYYLDPIKQRVKEGEDFLSSYFPSLKEEYFSKEKSKDKIDKFNEVYNKAIKNNTNILKIAHIIIDNVNELSDKSTYNVGRLHLNIYKHIKDSNHESIFEYVKYFDFHLVQFHRSIDVPCKELYCIIPLKDNRIAILDHSLSSSIVVLDPYNDYHVDIECIHLSDYSYASIMEDGRLLTCNDKFLTLYSLTKNSYKPIVIVECDLNSNDPNIINKANQNKTYGKQITALSNNTYAYIKDKKNIIIEEVSPVINPLFLQPAEDCCDYFNLGYPHQLVQIGLIKCTEKINSYKYIRNKNILIVALSNLLIQIWNVSSLQLITTIKIKGEPTKKSIDSIYQINNDKIIIFGYLSTFIVNIVTCKIEADLSNYIKTIYSCVTLRDNKTLLCGSSKGQMLMYNMETKEHSVLYFNEQNKFKDLHVIDDHTIISISDTLKIWKY